MFKSFVAALCLSVLCAGANAQSTAPAPAAAQSADFWRLVASPYTIHFHADEEHESVYAIGLERQRSDGWLWGGVYFSNSFGQPSGYVYLGQRYGGLFSVEKLFAQWTLGILYGYVEPYEDKVPFNYKGFSPGGVLSLGWQFNRQWSAQANLLGSAGMMLQLSYDFR
jgi:hypothetical protein